MIDCKVFQGLAGGPTDEAKISAMLRPVLRLGHWPSCRESFPQLLIWRLGASARQPTLLYNWQVASWLRGFTLTTGFLTLKAANRSPRIDDAPNTSCCAVTLWLANF